MSNASLTASATPPATVMTVALARQLAAQHPGATLPCPLCPATVNAPNLERHLGKAHASESQAGPGSGGAGFEAKGIDRAIVRPAIALLVVWGLGAAVVFALRVPLTDALIAGLGGALLVCFTPVLVAALGGFKASLSLSGDQLKLRWGLGIASRTVTLPAKLESGRLVETKSNVATGGHARDNAATHDQDAGVYLRLRSGSATITVASRKAGGLGKHWAQKGWAKGPKSRAADIEIERNALVALEYALAGRGQLQPRDAG